MILKQQAFRPTNSISAAHYVSTLTEKPFEASINSESQETCDTGGAVKGNVQARSETRGRRGEQDILDGKTFLTTSLRTYMIKNSAKS